MQDHLEGDSKVFAIQLEDLSSKTLQSPLLQVTPDPDQERKSKRQNLRSGKAFDVDSTDSMESPAEIKEHMSQSGTNPPCIIVG